MDNKPEILRSAARELCGFIDKANGVLQAGILPTDMQPPDYHDHQTCHELDVAANYVEALEQEVERLRKGIIAVRDLIDDSRGVVGLHENGEVAPWDTLERGGELESWLIEFNEAEDDLALHKEGES